MEVSVDSARRGSHVRFDTALSIGVGVVLGLVGRNLPTAVVTLVYRADQRRPCDDAVIACALAATPDVIGALVVLGLLVLTLALVFAAVGVLLLVRGLRRGAAGGIREPGVDEMTREVRPVARVVQTIVGTALIVPAVWLAVVVVASM